MRLAVQLAARPDLGSKLRAQRRTSLFVWIGGTITISFSPGRYVCFYDAAYVRTANSRSSKWRCVACRCHGF